MKEKIILLAKIFLLIPLSIIGIPIHWIFTGAVLIMSLLYKIILKIGYGKYDNDLRDGVGIGAYMFLTVVSRVGLNTPENDFIKTISKL